MINLSNSELEKLAVNFVGNKSNNEGVSISKKLAPLTPLNLEKLQEYFVSKFNSLIEYYQFTHPSSLKFNEVFNYCRDIFDGHMQFKDGASEISKHLYEHSTHAKINGSELQIFFLSNCLYGEKKINAIGICKTENKSGFFELESTGDNFLMNYKEGIDFNKLEKGCLILNTDAKDGFVVLNIDKQSNGIDAQYWKDDFLELKPKNDNYHFTKNLLTITKDYISTRLENEFEVSKTGKIDLLNKSVEYFKTNDNFNIKEFEENVFDDPAIIKSFQKFGSEYIEYNSIEIADSFEISRPAVKKQARIFKSILKLDKNFHIYIHGNNDLIEKGYDEKKKMNYYKVYFREEI